MSTKARKAFKLVPPDGGWGWMVLLGSAVCNVFNQSMLSMFALVYGDALEEMGHTTQGAAVVLSTMLFVTNFGGPIAGAVIRLTSARVVAVAGAGFCSLGIFFSAFSTNIWHLIMTYGILLGLGMGFIQNSTFVAINTYFTLRKSRAVGLANVGTGVGQVVMPHLVRYLLENYGFRGACLVLSSLSLHGICGTLLIQPVEWHMKKVKIEVEEEMKLMPVGKKLSQSDSDTGKDEKNGIMDRGSKILNNKEMNGGSINESKANGLNGDHNKKKTLMQKLNELFGISLLGHPRFVNIVIGVALGMTSIQNFSMLFPLFLQKVAQLDKQATANCMSAVAGADILGRLFLPIVQDKFKIKARWMLIMASFWIVVTRQILARQTIIELLLAMSALYGFGRSVIAYARNLAISENCRMDQVPAAIGLGMLTIGIIVPPVGYFLGWIRDYTGSYLICITAQDVLLVLLLVTWIPDMLLIRKEGKREQKRKNVNNLEI